MNWGVPGAVFPQKIKLTLAKEYICSSSFQHIEVQTCHGNGDDEDDANGDDDDDANGDDEDDANDGDEEEKEQTLAFPP